MARLDVEFLGAKTHDAFRNSRGHGKIFLANCRVGLYVFRGCDWPNHATLGVVSRCSKIPQHDLVCNALLE